jgi:hypothetical protein
MRYAVIVDGSVVNIVVATPEYAAQMGWIEATQDHIDEFNLLSAPEEE